MGKSPRLLELDVFRGIAALGVVLYHYTIQYNKSYGHSPEVLISFPFGTYGIELFFMISGFVIFMSLEKTQRGIDFVVGRFSRLYPAYWVAVFLTFTIVTVANLPINQVDGNGLLKLTWFEALVNLTMLQGFFNVPNVDGAYWTLAVELSFYIIMFAIYKAKLLKHIDTIAIGWLLLLVVSIVLEKQFAIFLDPRITTFFLLGRPHLSVYANLFIVGMMFYKIYSEGYSIKKYAIILGCLLVYKLQHYGWETAILIALIIIFHLMLRGKLAFINQKPLLFFGTISYTLYLVHQNIGYVIIRALYEFGINPNTSIFIALVSSIFLASTITFLVERPMMRLIRELYKTRILKQTSVESSLSIANKLKEEKPLKPR